MDIFKDIRDVWEGVVRVLVWAPLYLLLAISFPVWCLPYLLIKSMKEEK